MKNTIVYAISIVIVSRANIFKAAKVIIKLIKAIPSPRATSKLTLKLYFCSWSTSSFRMVLALFRRTVYHICILMYLRQETISDREALRLSLSALAVIRKRQLRLAIMTWIIQKQVQRKIVIRVRNPCRQTKRMHNPITAIGHVNVLKVV